jgi:hypothetical protein
VPLPWVFLRSLDAFGFSNPVARVSLVAIRRSRYLPSTP